MTEREREEMRRLRTELAAERKKRELIEAQLLELLDLLAPHLNMSRAECREGCQTFLV